jgi:putative glutamine amidotransferase
MTKPLIGITATPQYPHKLLPFDKVAHAYVNSVQNAGGIPVILPTDLSGEDVRVLRTRLDGILLSGGGDIDPARFGGTPSEEIGGVDNDRDEMEFSIVHLSVETNWPLLGICRGLQVINAALGGSLYTDIPEQYPTGVRHDTKEISSSRSYEAHEVRIIPESKLFNILKETPLRVNSFHHQAVLEPARELRISAYASDGLIEGLEFPDHRFLVGVQWHPECLQRKPEQRALFNAFIQAASA